jgi:hypothetical protein
MGVGLIRGVSVTEIISDWFSVGIGVGSGEGVSIEIYDVTTGVVII